jgi:hypothetical protein
MRALPNAIICQVVREADAKATRGQRSKSARPRPTPQVSARPERESLAQFGILRPALILDQLKGGQRHRKLVSERGDVIMWGSRPGAPLAETYYPNLKLLTDDQQAVLRTFETEPGGHTAHTCAVSPDYGRGWIAPRHPLPTRNVS